MTSFKVFWNVSFIYDFLKFIRVIGTESQEFCRIKFYFIYNIIFDIVHFMGMSTIVGFENIL